MAANVIDGKALAATLRAEIKTKSAALREETGVTPGLGVILVGEDPASQSYVTAKERALAEAGMRSFDYRLPAETSQAELLDLIGALNANPEVHGILVQLPLPKGLDEAEVIRAIAPEKDVDGFTPVNVGKMVIGEECFLPCTPHGVIKMLERAGVETKGAHAVVIGRSNIVGKPVAHLLAAKRAGGNATVTLCHTATKDLAAFTRQADILVVASGRPNTVTGEMVKPGATVIDVGVNRVPCAETASGYKLCGDCDYASVSQVAAHLTPVPGGVGPMTITMLLENTYQAALRSVKRSL